MIRRLSTEVASTALRSAWNQQPPINYEKLFTQEHVRKLLKSLAGCEPLKIFRNREISEIEKPKYVLMTEEDIQKMEELVKIRCEERLRMPPLKCARTNHTTVLSFDAELAGFDNTKFIFTDTDPEASSEERTVVVRETDGTLRTATDDERDRMNRVYFPKFGQKVHTPEVFRQPYFSKALSEKKYEFLLDWACTQFEPDATEYIQITNEIYDHVDFTNCWSALYSTRYYGNLVFRLIVEMKHENLMKYYLDNKRLEEAANIARLFIHTKSFEKDNSTDSLSPSLLEPSLDILKHYATHNAIDKKKIQKAIKIAASI